jgi:cytochrome subunit of sulfide dehydrogenase
VTFRAAALAAAAPSSPGQLMRAMLAAILAASLATPVLAQSATPPGAAACSGCHGADARVAPIRGRDAKDLADAMRAFRSGERPATVMDRIAKGFSEDETQAIANWLSSQR